MSDFPKVVDKIPATDDGTLSDFNYNARAQRIFLTAECPLSGYSTLINIKAEFEGVVYLALVNNDRVRLSDENGVDRFEELPISSVPTFVDNRAGVQQALSQDSVLCIDDREGWQFLVTDFGTKVAGQPNSRVRLRCFIIDSGSLSAKFICQAATFELTPGLPITWGRSG